MIKQVNIHEIIKTVIDVYTVSAVRDRGPDTRQSRNSYQFREVYLIDFIDDLYLPFSVFFPFGNPLFGC